MNYKGLAVALLGAAALIANSAGYNVLGAILGDNTTANFVGNTLGLLIAGTGGAMSGKNA